MRIKKTRKRNVGRAYWANGKYKAEAVKKKPPALYGYEFSEDMPETVRKWVVYVVGGEKQHWAACLKCPCGCGSTIHLNLLREANPCWRIRIKHERVSISPSIWKLQGCLSHFFIRNGSVLWAKF